MTQCKGLAPQIHQKGNEGIENTQKEVLFSSLGATFLQGNKAESWETPEFNPAGNKNVWKQITLSCQVRFVLYMGIPASCVKNTQ